MASLSEIDEALREPETVFLIFDATEDSYEGGSLKEIVVVARQNRHLFGGKV